MKLPATIDEVIDELELILEESIRADSPLGLFTALYQKVTIKVKEGIEKGRFENAVRMEKLDVVFANRYIDAYRKYTSNQAPTHSWKIAFDAAKESNLILLQHLFLGMSTHINLDLGIAAAEISKGISVDLLKNDFMEINQLLFELIEEVQQNISTVSPFIGLVDWFGKEKDEQFAQFSMRAARDHAWLVAQRLAITEEQSREGVIKSTDEYVLALNKLILKPGRILKMVLWLVRLMESKDMKKNIQALRAA